MKKIISDTCELTGCHDPASHVIGWQHQDGDHDQRRVCDIHAHAERDYWQRIGAVNNFDPRIELRPIEPIDKVIYIPDHLVGDYAGAELLELTDQDRELLGASKHVGKSPEPEEHHALGDIDPYSSTDAHLAGRQGQGVG